MRKTGRAAGGRRPGALCPPEATLGRAASPAAPPAARAAWVVKGRGEGAVGGGGGEMGRFCKMKP